MYKALLIAAALALTPALAAGSDTASFTAVDFAWHANGTDATSLTVAPGTTVTFGYPDGATSHNLRFIAAKPSSCQNIPPGPRPKGWQGDCTFTDPGTYPFVCDVHAGMQGTVVVETPPAPTPEPTPVATAGPAPVATATPAPLVQTTLAVKLAAKQRGTRVRGTVDVKQAASKLEVTVTARLGKARVRVGHLVKPAASGSVAFSVPLDAKARRVLRSRRSLAVTVAVTLTPPGATKLVHSGKALIRPR